MGLYERVWLGGGALLVGRGVGFLWGQWHGKWGVVKTERGRK